jgi:hypothetical protein
MAIMMVLKIDGGTLEQYDQATKEVFGGTLTPSELPKGLWSHVCVQTDDGIKVVDVWESKADFEAFGVKLMPALQHAQLPPEMEPKFYDVHNFLKA